MKGLSGEGGRLNISHEIQIVYFFFKIFWLSFMKRDFCFRFVHAPKKSTCPNRVVANLKKMGPQETVCPFKAALFAQPERLKNTLVKGSGSIFNQMPHIVIGHTPVWHTAQKSARRGL